MNKTKIIFHQDESDVAAHDDISVIDGWHEKRGFKSIGWNGEVIHCGYNFFIKSDGTLQKGRSLEVRGAHCFGENDDAIGVCLHGKSIFYEKQFETAKWLIEELEVMFNRKFEIGGHCDYDSRKPHCPGYDYDQFK